MFKPIVATFLLTAILASVALVPLVSFAQAGGVAGAGINTLLGGGKCGGLAGFLGGKIQDLANLGAKGLGKLGIKIGKSLGLAGTGKSIKNTFLGGGSRVPVEVEGDVKDAIGELKKKECTLDPFVKIITGSLISAMTSKIVGWIQGEGGKNVGYVGSFEKTLKHELNVRSGEFLNQLAGVNLCGNVRPFLRIALGTPQGLRRSLGCSVTDIVDNVEDFFNDFQKGGWNAFMQVSLNPQNNPYGAYLIALDASVQAQDERRRSIEAGYQAGGAFLGFRVPEEVCEPIDQAAATSLLSESPTGSYDDIPGVKRDESGQLVTCHTRYVTKTPGQTVVSLLNKAVGAGIDSAVSADEIDEALSSIITALINRIIGQSAGVFRDGVFRSGGPGILDDTDPREGLAVTQQIAFNQEIGSEPEGETDGSGGTGGGGGGGTDGGGTGGTEGGGTFTNEQQVKLILDIVAEVRRLQNAIATLDNSFNTEVQTLLPTLADLLTEKAKPAPDSSAVSQLTTTVNNSNARLTSLLADRNSFITTKNNLLDETNLTKALSVIDAATFQATRQSIDSQTHLITATLTNKGLPTDYPEVEGVPVNNFIQFIQEEGQEAYRVSGRATNFKNTDFPTIVLPVLSAGKKTELTNRLAEFTSPINLSVADIQELDNFLSANTDLANGDFPQPGPFTKQVRDVVTDLATQENGMDSLIIQIVKAAAQ